MQKSSRVTGHHRVQILRCFPIVGMEVEWVGHFSRHTYRCSTYPLKHQRQAGLAIYGTPHHDAWD